VWPRIRPAEAKKPKTPAGSPECSLATQWRSRDERTRVETGEARTGADRLPRSGPCRSFAGAASARLYRANGHSSAGAGPIGYEFAGAGSAPNPHRTFSCARRCARDGISDAGKRALSPDLTALLDIEGLRRRRRATRSCSRVRRVPCRVEPCLASLLRPSRSRRASDLRGRRCMPFAAAKRWTPHGCAAPRFDPGAVPEDRLRQSGTDRMAQDCECGV
jgi:hypothetical protein